MGFVATVDPASISSRWRASSRQFRQEIENRRTEGVVAIARDHVSGVRYSCAFRVRQQLQQVCNRPLIHHLAALAANEQ